MSGIVIDELQGVRFPVPKIYSYAGRMDKFLQNMNEASRYQIFGYRNRAIEDGKLYTGSFGYYWNSYPQKDDCNKTIGDIDVIMPFGSINYVMKYLREKGITFKKRGTQVSCIYDLLEDGSPVQIDFEFKAYFDYLPTEFSIFSNSWSKQDAEIGLKGGFHKILLSSMTAAHDDVYSFSVDYGIAVRDKFERTSSEKFMHASRDMEFIYISLFKFNSSDINLSDFEYIKDFRGCCALMVDNFNDDQIDKVIAKFNRRVSERTFDLEQIKLCETLFKSYGLV